MLRKTGISLVVVVVSVLAIGVCDPAGEEPEPIQLAVSVSNAGMSDLTNDLGYSVSVAEFRVALQDVEFTIGGEIHASLFRSLSRAAICEAFAHPGHPAGGDVTGEMLGSFLADFVSDNGEVLGEATLLPGDYNSVNLFFRLAGTDDGLAQDDPLLNHTALIAGTAGDSDGSMDFVALVDIAEGTQMVGGTFDMKVAEGSGEALGLAVYTIDPFEGDTLFDGVDFRALDGDGDGMVEIFPGDEAHDSLMKALVRHDHWGVEVE